MRVGIVVFVVIAMSCGEPSSPDAGVTTGGGSGATDGGRATGGGNAATGGGGGGGSFTGGGTAIGGGGNVATGGGTGAPTGPIPHDGGVNFAFVTSSTFTGALGGLAGADARCQSHAIDAGLPGHFQAFLSTSTVAAKNRLGSANGWVLPNGKPHANTQRDVLDRHIFFPLEVDEHGTRVDDVAWTGTSAIYEAFSSSTCLDWSSASSSRDGIGGFLPSAGLEWIGGATGSFSCDSALRLYCFGIDGQAEVAPAPVQQFRRAFMSSAPFRPGPDAGLAGADALCNGEANDAGLTGHFLAFLATAGQSAAARFSSDGGVWLRVDGAPLSATPEALLDASAFEPFDVALTVHADGTFGFDAVWIGATAPNVPGANAGTCRGWSSNSSADVAIYGSSTDRSSWAFTAFDYACSSMRPLPVYCFQE